MSAAREDPEADRPRGTPNLAIIGELLGNPARLAMLQSLMSGRALTAGELARVASVSAPTASEHLARLTEARLLEVQRQGRHRYYRLAGRDVAETIERLMSLADRIDATHLVTGPADPALRRARACYDHLAGDLAVRFFDAAVDRGWFDARPVHDETTTVVLTDVGARGLTALGVDVAPDRGRAPCRACMDWSERRHHLAGTLGARLLTHCLARGWGRRAGTSRAVTFDARGERALLAPFAGDAT